MGMDSIWKKLSGAALSGIVSAAADNLVFFILHKLNVANLPALALSRLVSVMINYLLLRYAVFRETGKGTGSFLRYILLVLFSSTIVYFLLEFFTAKFSGSAPLMKILIEIVMFFFNFFISKKLVFTRGMENEK